MPRVERRCVQGRPVIVTGSGECRNGWNQTGRRERGPGEFDEQMQRRGRSLDEGGGNIAHAFVPSAGAIRFLGMSWRLFGSGMLLPGAATSDLFPLRGHDAAPAHRQADAKGEDQGCEAGEHEWGSDSDTPGDVQMLQAMIVPVSPPIIRLFSESFSRSRRRWLWRQPWSSGMSIARLFR